MKLKLNVGDTVMVKWNDEPKPLRVKILKFYRGHRERKIYVRHGYGYPAGIFFDQVTRVVKRA